MAEVRRAKLKSEIDEVEFDALLSETVSRSSLITDKFVEKGSIISDHIQENPLIVTIEAVMVKNAPTNLKTLRKFIEKKELLTYIGRNEVNKVAIETLDTVHPKENLGGFNFTMTLKIIKTTESQQVEVAPPEFVALPEEKDKKKTKATSTKGTQQKLPSNLDASSESDLNDKVSEAIGPNEGDFFILRGY